MGERGAGCNWSATSSPPLVVDLTRRGGGCSGGAVARKAQEVGHLKVGRGVSLQRTVAPSWLPVAAAVRPHYRQLPLSLALFMC